MEAIVIPRDCIQTGALGIALYSTPDGGTGVAYNREDISTEAAIGAMTIILDKLRADRAEQWADGRGHIEDGYFVDEEDDDVLG